MASGTRLIQLTQEWSFHAGLSTVGLSGVGDKGVDLLPADVFGYMLGRSFEAGVSGAHSASGMNDAKVGPPVALWGDPWPRVPAPRCCPPPALHAS